MLKQFDTYKKESIIKGNKPEKDENKVWIDYKSKFIQFEHNTIPIEKVTWYPYQKFYLRNGCRTILIKDKNKLIIPRFIKLNWFERIIEWILEGGLTPVMAWLGGIMGIIIAIKQIFC